MNKKKIARKLKELLKILPDRIYIQLYYFFRFHKFCHLKNPKTYNEKIQWLKLYDRNPMYSNLVDKYEVKKIVANIIGEEHIIKTLGIWENFDEIDFKKLPNQFVLKCTHDSEGIIVVKDKNKLNYRKAKRKIERAMKCNFFYIGREWPYKNVKPRIIAEEYMEDNTYHELRDYKFLCFNGKPEIMYIAAGRFNHQTTIDFYDMDFNHLDITHHYPKSLVRIEKPITFNKMIELSKKLSKDFKHIRVDFYEVNGKIYFGELTFYSFSGFSKIEPIEWDYKLGELINLENK
ncbi:MAG: hypothetical protein J1F35_00410 [Erysipelotrichales bacterium]|nr:hypothetical protein [Erysipelotrichales bacterium]